MGFGFGRHACPGRFFAANEIKLIVARLLMDFDIKMPEGRTERFENIAMSGNIMPDFGKEILLKRVAKA
jgi:cytochrome P450